MNLLLTVLHEVKTASKLLIDTENAILCNLFSLTQDDLFGRSLQCTDSLAQHCSTSFEPHLSLIETWSFFFF